MEFFRMKAELNFRNLPQSWHVTWVKNLKTKCLSNTSLFRFSWTSTIFFATEANFISFQNLPKAGSQTNFFFAYNRNFHKVVWGLRLRSGLAAQITSHWIDNQVITSLLHGISWFDKKKILQNYLKVYNNNVIKPKYRLNCACDNIDVNIREYCICNRYLLI